MVFWSVGVEFGKLDLVLWAFLVCTAVSIGFAAGTVVHVE